MWVYPGGLLSDEVHKQLSVFINVCAFCCREPHFEVEANMTVMGSFDGWLDFNITSAATQWTYFPNTNLGLYTDITDQTGMTDVALESLSL